MTKNLKILIFCIAIILIVGIGLGVYFPLSYAKKEIKLDSFDDRTTFSIGKHRVDKLREDTHYLYVSTAFKDAVPLDEIENDQRLVAKKSSKPGTTTYLFLQDGYYFTLFHQGPSLDISIKNTHIEAFSMDIAGRMFVPGPFDNNPQLSFSDNLSDRVTFLAWSYFKFFSDFDSLATLCEKINSEYDVKIDYTSKSISLKFYVFNKYAYTGIVDNKRLVLSCDNDDGINFSIEDSK
ncbi:MAG: hypothetical protein LBU04_03935 [Christensenellaceae bacterium]|jgi:hypothetical protein|nr:hypothetical protein [Christensenellaceae bacterium]